MCNALRGLPPLLERHLRDWCVLFSGRKEQVHLRSGERSPAPCSRTAVGGRRETGREHEEGRVIETRETAEWKRCGKWMRERERGWKRKTEGWNGKKNECMHMRKSKRPTSVTHYPPGPLSGNCSIWHNSQQTSLWLQMGIEMGGGGKVIQGKGAIGAGDLSRSGSKGTWRLHQRSDLHNDSVTRKEKHTESDIFRSDIWNKSEI